jgi:hypothetical protein
VPLTVVSVLSEFSDSGRIRKTELSDGNSRPAIVRYHLVLVGN